jgi:hypothetical protein
MSANSRSLLTRSMTGSSFGFLTRSILFRIAMTGIFSGRSRPKRCCWPPPGFCDTSSTTPTTSTSRIASSAASTIRMFIRCVGL